MTREEAVEVLKERYLTCVGIGLDNHANRVNEAIDMAIEALSAEVGQRGEWVWDEDAVDFGIGAWCCSECLCRAQTWWSTDRNKNPLICAGSRFCGNCGADMRGDSE